MAVILVVVALPKSLEARPEALQPTAEARGIVTALALDETLLAAAGIEVVELESTAPSLATEPLSVLPAGAPAFAAEPPFGLRWKIADGRFGGFVAGTAAHRGGFELRFASGVLSLRGFGLRSGPAPRTVEIVDVDGEAAFVADHLHYRLDPETGRLRIDNADLRLAPALARRLGRPELAGLAVGVLALEADVDLPRGTAPTTCPENWEGVVDAALIALDSVGQRARAGGRVVLAPSVTLKNVGTADIPWYRKFSGTFPPYGNDQHPYLVWALYRLGPAGFEQLAVSQAKHAFRTVNANCTGCGADDQILGVGCEDVYGEATNSSNVHLGPREEIEAGTGVWAHCDEPEPRTPSHFDADGDCIFDHRGEGVNPFLHGMVVAESDLATPGARYFFHAWYVVRDDENIWNSMVWREIRPELSEGVWLFPFAGPLVAGSPLDAWVDPADPGPGARNETVETTVGHLQLAVRAEPRGLGVTRFRYALMNHDDDRRLRRFSLPLAAGARVKNVRFRDFDADPANDWRATVTPDAILWQAPTDGAALDWGRMIAFTFDANAPAGEDEGEVRTATGDGEILPTLVPGPGVKESWD